MFKVIQIMHICYTALHYKLTTPDIMQINDIVLKVLLKRQIDKLCLRAAKITQYLNTRSVYTKLLPPD
jgi:spore coat protein CotF